MIHHAAFLNLDIDLDELAAVVSRALGVACRLEALPVKCTYPVFRGETAAGARAFVKVGTREEWLRTRCIQDEVGDSDLFPRLLAREPLDYAGYAVFVTDWKAFRSVAPEEMTPTQVAALVRGCGKLSALLQRVSPANRTALADSPFAPVNLHADLERYARRHPLASRILGDLLRLPERKWSLDGHAVGVVHGDFHFKNYGFSASDELTAVFDFDKLTEGLVCWDLANALADRFSRLGLAREARRRLCAVTRQVLAAWSGDREEFEIACHAVRLRYAAHRIRRHLGSPFAAFDIARRDCAIREILTCFN